MLAPDYTTAREQFREAVAALGWSQESWPIAARGPQGEELTIDVALSPGLATAPLFWITSGVHGVEGFFGSAVQVQALRHFQEQPFPQSLRCVMIHAVNPYGFAHWRRFDENNVDTNRNYLLPGEAYEGSPPLYGACDPVLNPKKAPHWPDGFLLQAAGFLLRHGYTALKQAVAGGQYDYPQGLFFGGKAPSESSQILLKHLPRLVQEAPRILHLDFHTGLGKWATYKLLVDPPLTPDQLLRAETWFGAKNLQAASPKGIDYHTRGGFGGWCKHYLADRDYLHLCAEFGTYPTFQMVMRLRRENQFHHWGRADAAGFARARLAIKDAFGPADPSWQSTVLKIAQTLIQQALSNLS